MSFNVLPRVAMSDVKDRRLCHQETTGQFALCGARRVSRTDVSDDLCSQLGRTTSAALLPHVLVVVDERAEKEMALGVDTTGHIAMVQYIRPICDWAVEQFPCDAVGFGCWSTWNREQAVTLEGGASPEPAPRAECRVNRPVLVDLRPETRRWRNRFGCYEACPGTEAMRPLVRHRSTVLAGTTRAFPRRVTAGARAMMRHLTRTRRAALLAEADESWLNHMAIVSRKP